MFQTQANRLLKDRIEQKFTREYLDKWYHNQEDKERAIQLLFRLASRIFSWVCIRQNIMICLLITIHYFEFYLSGTMSH